MAHPIFKKPYLNSIKTLYLNSHSQITYSTKVSHYFDEKNLKAVNTLDLLCEIKNNTTFTPPMVKLKGLAIRYPQKRLVIRHPQFFGLNFFKKLVNKVLTPDFL